jgi:signal transduction histidine kinase
MTSGIADRDPSDPSFIEPSALLEPSTSVFGTPAEREEIRRLVQKERALRNLADLIARSGADVDIIAIIVREASRQILDLPVTLCQFVGQRELLVLASPDGPAEAGTRIVFEVDTLPDTVLRTGSPFRVDDYEAQPDAELARGFGLVAGVGVPIVVDGSVWGMFAIMSGRGPLPVETEARITAFAQLVTASFDSIEARSRLRAVEERDEIARRLQQDAGGASTAELAERLVVYASRLRGVERATLRLKTGLETSADNPVVAIRNSSIRPMQSVPFPVASQGQNVGVLSIHTTLPTLPDQTHQFLTDMGHVFGRVIAADTNRQYLGHLVEEQASLRRVAELAARGVPLPELFQTVVDNTVRLFEASRACLYHGGAEKILAASSPLPPFDDSGPGSETLDADSADTSPASDRLVLPIIVEDVTWGVLTAEWASAPPDGTAARLQAFANLTAIAIANADYREGLTKSRARIVAAGDNARRRLQRDVHDGAQQRIVHAILNLKLARDKARAGKPVVDLLDEAIRNAEDANRQLRDIVRGVLPAALTRAGLVAGIEAFVADVTVQVELELDIPRLPPSVEVTGYFLVAETLTNAVKHAGAAVVTVTARLSDLGDELVVVVSDNGVGGADPAGGSGITGLIDRVEAGNGTLEIVSPPGSGTRVTARFPLDPPLRSSGSFQ